MSPLTSAIASFQDSLEVTDYANDRNMLTRPLLLFQNLVAVGLDPLDLANIDFAAANSLQAHHFQLLGFG